MFQIFTVKCIKRETFWLNFIQIFLPPPLLDTASPQLEGLSLAANHMNHPPTHPGGSQVHLVAYFRNTQMMPQI